MHTLLEFMKHTEQWQYIVGFCGVISFVLFWKLLAKTQPSEEKEEAEEEKAHTKTESYSPSSAGSLVPAPPTLQAAQSLDTANWTRGQKACPYRPSILPCWEIMKQASGRSEHGERCQRCEVYLLKKAGQVVLPHAEHPSSTE